jgi:hypothetical protein
MNAGDETARVIVCQADDGEAGGWRILGRRGRRNCDCDQGGEEKPFHGEQIMPFLAESKTKSFFAIHFFACSPCARFAI